jgi:hypothetical protein
MYAVAGLEQPAWESQLVFDPEQEDDPEFEELTVEQHDSKLSRFSLEQMEEIVNKYFVQHWDFWKSIKPRYGVHDVKQIHRYHLLIGFIRVPCDRKTILVCENTSIGAAQST